MHWSYVSWSDNTPSQLCSYIQPQCFSSLQSESAVTLTHALLRMMLTWWGDLRLRDKNFGCDPTSLWMSWSRGRNGSRRSEAHAYIKELRHTQKKAAALCRLVSCTEALFRHVSKISLKALWAAPSWLLLDLPTLCGQLLGCCHFNRTTPTLCCSSWLAFVQTVPNNCYTVTERFQVISYTRHENQFKADLKNNISNISNLFNF